MVRTVAAFSPCDAPHALADDFLVSYWHHQQFQIFDQVYIMTARTIRGGVGGSARTLSLYLYESGFIHSEYGYASTIAFVCSSLS